MISRTIKMQLDLYGNPFIVDACTTDGSPDGKTLSTYEWMKEEIATCTYEDLFSVIDKAGIYRVTSNYDDYPDFTFVDTEPEAVFLATQWLLDNKDKQ